MKGNDSTVMRLPDGSGFSTASFPLPADHWLYADGHNEPPMGMRTGTEDPMRVPMAAAVGEAARYAVRAATMNGTERDFDPDALVQNMVVGLLGYFTKDGLPTSETEVRARSREFDKAD